MALVSGTLRRRLSLSSSAYFKSRTSLIASDGVRSMSTANVRKENIVIIGGGITGLASAISLQRLGIRSLVLEQAKSLRTGENPVILTKNDLKVFDAIGIGDELWSNYPQVKGFAIYSEGKELVSCRYGTWKYPLVPYLKRRVLLEMLASKLPVDAISFASKVAKIETSENGNTLLQLENGSHISAEVVIACDGVWSPTAKWMGFREPKFAGAISFCGTGYFPEGHPYEPYEREATCFRERGVLCYFLPVSKTEVHWGFLYNSSSQGSMITDPSILKQQAKELVKNCPFDMSKLVNSTLDDTITRFPYFKRWLWPLITPPASTGRVVLVGDAWHPFSPYFLRRRCALEDAVLLTEKLADALKSKKYSVEDAFKAYGSERRKHVFNKMVIANIDRMMIHSENRLVCSVSNFLWAVVYSRDPTLPKKEKHNGT